MAHAAAISASFAAWEEIAVNVCSDTYLLLTSLTTRIVELYKLIWNEVLVCARQRCRWWCLCCEHWLCWIGLAIAAILTTILLIVEVLVSVAVITTCWGTCILIFIFTFGGNFGRASLNCFVADPTPPAPAPRPTVRVTVPDPHTPERFFLPTDVVTFAAVAEDVDGTPLTGMALAWFDTFGGISDRPLGTGTPIDVTLELLADDAAAGRVTHHTVTVVATGADGTTSRPAVTGASIRQGLS